jgi:hypothetical protein
MTAEAEHGDNHLGSFAVRVPCTVTGPARSKTGISSRFVQPNHPKGHQIIKISLVLGDRCSTLNSIGSLSSALPPSEAQPIQYRKVFQLSSGGRGPKALSPCTSISTFSALWSTRS